MAHLPLLGVSSAETRPVPRISPRANRAEVAVSFFKTHIDYTQPCVEPRAFS